MPRLVNPVTGVIVNVRDGKVLDGYVPVDAAPAAPVTGPVAKPAVKKPAAKQPVEKN
jgi:hypothetical protein